MSRQTQKVSIEFKTMKQGNMIVHMVVSYL